MSLPKGTEHFLSDLHGEATAFTHVLKNASGQIRRKVDDIFGKVYQQQNPQGGDNPGAGANPGAADDGTVESNFTDN